MTIKELSTPISVQTMTKTKTSLSQIVTVVLSVVVIAGMLGFFSSALSYSAVVGLGDFQAAAGKGGGPGGGKVKPSLEVKLATVPVAQSVVAGTKEHTFVILILGAEVLDGDVEIREITFTVTTDNQTNPAEVSNFGLFDGDTQLAVSEDPDRDTSTKTLDGESAVVNFIIAQPIIITKGTSKALLVKGDISTAAVDGVYQVGIQELPKKSKLKIIDVYAVGGNKPLNSNYQFSPGPAMTFVRSGELLITRDASNPKAGLIPANTNGITLAVFRAVALYEDINIEKMYITGEQVNNGGWDQVDKLYIYQGSTLVAEVTPTSTDGVDKIVLIDISNNPIVVPKDESTKLTFKADTADSNYELGSIGESGQGIRLKINNSGDVIAKSAQSGGVVETKIANAAGNPQYLFRSVPIVATNDLLSSGKVVGGILNPGVESNKPLYAFSVTADSAGDVGLSQATFLIRSSNVEVRNIFLYEGNIKVASSTAPWNIEIQPMIMIDPDTGSAWSFVKMIPTNTTKTFTLKGDVYCLVDAGCAGSNGSGIVSIQMLGDESFPNPLPGVGFNMRQNSNFTWTDFWRTPILESSSTTAQYTEQWSNGYLVSTVDGGTMPPVSSAVIFSR